MESSNVIAYLFPVGDQVDAQVYRNALQTIRLSENSLRYVPGQHKVDIELETYSRESTVSLDDSIKDSAPEYPYQPALQLTFEPGPKAGSRYVIGTDKNSCDIVLPKLSNISRCHCFLTFDEKRRLTLHDASRYGTIVTYGGEGKEKRRNFKWILSGHEVPDDTKNIILEFSSDLKFRIVVPKHQRSQDLYAKYVDRFLQNTDLPIGTLGIQSASTTAKQSRAYTPVQGPIYIPGENLGSGAFSDVSRVWDVSTGNLYALKTFRNVHGLDWRKEADIMGQISHEHIIEFIHVKETPSPGLILEYAPLGCLAKQAQISGHEAITILCQSLKALIYLHGKPIVHRDIKPQNILVLSRNPLHIKLADFGLSKAASTLNTMCGTEAYAAPEVFDGHYTKSCDIWSLGVVIFEYVYGLPKREGHRRRQWCGSILRALHDRDPDSLIEFLSNTMLIMNPEKRLSAEKCYTKAVLLLTQPDPKSPSTSHARLQDSNPLTVVGLQNIPLQSLQPGTQSKDPTIVGTLRSNHQQGDHTEGNLIQEYGVSSKRLRSVNGSASGKSSHSQRNAKRPAIGIPLDQLNQKNLVSTSAASNHQGKGPSRGSKTGKTRSNALDTSDIHEGSLSYDRSDNTSSSNKGVTYPSDLDLMKFC